jgi:hypothetical protein
MLGIEAAEALGIPKGIKLAEPPDGWGVRWDTLLFSEIRASIKLADRSMQLQVPVKKRNRKAMIKRGGTWTLGCAAACPSPFVELRCFSWRSSRLQFGILLHLSNQAQLNGRSGFPLQQPR